MELNIFNYKWVFLEIVIQIVSHSKTNHWKTKYWETAYSGGSKIPKFPKAWMFDIKFG